MKKYTLSEALTISDNSEALFNRIAVQAVITENKKVNKEEVRKMQKSIIDMVDNYMSSVE